jgi:hypothetical protein
MFEKLKDLYRLIRAYYSMGKSYLIMRWRYKFDKDLK